MTGKRKFLASNPNVTMRIGGEVVSKIVARYTYRCAECLGELEYHNAGLACKEAGTGHRFFIHRKNVSEMQALRNAEISEMERNYEIVDGLLRPKGELVCR